MWRHTRIQCDPTERQLARCNGSLGARACVGDSNAREDLILPFPHIQMWLWGKVVLDLGRRPEARFLGVAGGEYLREDETSWTDLRAAEAAVGQFGGDNRAGLVTCAYPPMPASIARLLKRTIKDTGWHASDTMHLPCVPAQL